MENKVLIIIQGGAVQSILKPTDVVLEIRDYDVEEVDAMDNPTCKQDGDGDWYQEMLWKEGEIDD